MNPDPNSEEGPVNRHPIGCLGGAAAWLLLTFTLPAPWGNAIGAAGLIGYGLWVVRQTHERRPGWHSGFGGRNLTLEQELKKYRAEMKRKTPPEQWLLHPAEPMPDGEHLLRPAEGSGESDPDKLLRSASEPKGDTV